MLLAAVAAIFVAAAITPLAHLRWPRATAAGTVLAALALAVVFTANVPAIASGQVTREAQPWAPALGVELAFKLDGLALVFALIITWVGALVLLYTIGSMHGPARRGRMLALLQLFMGSMLGLVLADDAIVLVVFWELTSVCSYFLIAFDDTSARARRNATQALVITGAGGLVLLVGVILVAHASPAGTSISLLASDSTLRDHVLYPAIVVTIAIAAFTKSAHVPFHVWLPNAMVAPTPVSTYLHSATMVKAGIYVLARFSPALGGTPLWTGLLVAVGGVSAVFGAALSVMQRDLKLLLAYSTISALGAMTVMLGLGTHDAVKGFVWLLVAHAAYKATLFMVAGNVDHHRGHRNPFALRRLAGEMPASAGAAVLGAASMAGLPPFFGFIAKEAYYLGALTGPVGWIVSIAIVGASMLLVTAAWIAAFEPFFRGGFVRPSWHDAPASAIASPIVLALAALAFGIAPGLTIAPIARSAVAALGYDSATTSVTLWMGVHGIHGIVLAESAASFLAGTAIYMFLTRRVGGVAHLDATLSRVSFTRLYAGVVTAARDAFGALSRALLEGSLRTYVAIVVATAAIAIGIPLALELDHVAPAAMRWPGIGELALFVLAAPGAIGAVLANHRLVAIVSLSATGIAISILFALLSAPDLAITQIVVETLMVILLVAVFRHLPPIMRPM